jgi:hypothetical protein
VPSCSQILAILEFSQWHQALHVRASLRSVPPPINAIRARTSGHHTAPAPRRWRGQSPIPSEHRPLNEDDSGWTLGMKGVPVDTRAVNLDALPAPERINEVPCTHRTEGGAGSHRSTSPRRMTGILTPARFPQRVAWRLDGGCDVNGGENIAPRVSRTARCSPLERAGYRRRTDG